uniref:TRAF-type zinc finger domain-containing protein 1 n=1 Tax=Latimeria chalumnae TaxID=7897 RepID=H3ANH3_LATCH|nr:PREDICTED: TRAF-type zinc finger domain-containing protein 1 isoform X1 [Latimeria chalumnae]XP_014344079.1 PREDICTED: TRAF-type zinc finger domain-containing protein 1 isoform X1 [Latimeria chalumnae]XP_014344080.1 PREDICTED: TRAF-type zinc finger domain-containing protein 1 isoform X1 [Latimeria chalumnae]|eukprot:XP_014344078.1 PREDICTED: TRAF-type zinc finger domain-containing protein 1 isoform X1 [Latimeria chalumnae]
MSSASEKETKLCTNCKRDIPSGNFTIHEIHCRRNIELCRFCKEPFPRSEMEEHVEHEHAQIMCKCNVKMEKHQLENHQISECPLRLVKCQYCDLELAFNKCFEHEDYCGARTEQCQVCARNVMVKDLNTHPAVCGKPVEEKNNNCIGQRTQYDYEDDVGAWFEKPSFRSFLRTEEISSRRRTRRSLEREYIDRMTLEALQALEKNTPARTMDQNRVEEQEKLARNRAPRPGFYGHGDEHSNLDYLLALTLQNENHPSIGTGDELQTDALGNFYSKESGPVEDFAKSLNATVKTFFNDDPSLMHYGKEQRDDIALPCEFCEELFPEEDLILHQTGCNAASAFASFSKRSSSPPVEYPRGFGGYSEHSPSARFLSDRFVSLPYEARVESQESIILPCEFCGCQLEEEVLFHHQDKCDLRPATARPGSSLYKVLHNKDQEEEDKSPQSPRRRLKHQGDVGSSHVQRIASKGTFQSKTFNPARTLAPRNQELQESLADLGIENSFRSPSRVVKHNQGSLDIKRKIQNAPVSTSAAAYPNRDCFNESFTSNLLQNSQAKNLLSKGSEGSRTSKSPAAATPNLRNRTTKVNT